MAQAIATLQGLAELLGLCSSCKHRLTADGSLPATTNDASQEEDVRYIRSMLTDVSFKDTRLHNVKLMDCEWENVSFIGCQLSDVVFHNMKLIDVRFYNVDFRKVRMVHFGLTDIAFRDQYLKQLMITSPAPTSTTAREMRRMFPVTRTLLFSNTVSRTLPARAIIDSRPLDKVASVDVGPSAVSTPIEAVELLDLPASILEKIMHELYPRCDIFIYDVPIAHSATWQTRQTTYEVTQGDESARTTYFAMYRLCSDATLAACERRYLTLRGICCAFLRASRACYNLAIKHIYNRPFGFVGSADSCLAFLHDHRGEEHRMANIAVFFYDCTTRLRFATNRQAWRRLFNVLVHERSDLNSFVLVLNSSFWENVPWEAGAEAVFGHHDNIMEITQGDCYEQDKRNYLQHPARLPARTEWKHEDTEEPNRINFEVQICETKGSPERMAFVKELNQYMLRRMQQRPNLARQRYGSCTETQLEQSCYFTQAGKRLLHC